MNVEARRVTTRVLTRLRHLSGPDTVRTTGSGKSVLKQTEGRRTARARVDVINFEVMNL